MDTTEEYLRISELSLRSGVPVSKIRYFIARQIVPPPIRVNKTSAYYTIQHLERLRLIKKLLDENKLSIARIKDILESLSQIEGKKQYNHPDGSKIVRDKIVDSSISVFRSRGYEKATITDIAELAGVSRNSIYQHFKGKKELFINSVNKIFVDWRKGASVPNDQTSAVEVLEKNFGLAYKAFPVWSDMLNLLRVSAAKEPETFADKLEASLNNRVNAIAADIEKGINQGIFRQLDIPLASIMLAGISEYLCYYLQRGKFGERSAAEIAQEAFEIFLEGIQR